MLKKITILALALLLGTASLLPASAGPSPVVTTVASASSSSTGFGAWVAGGIIAVAAFFDAYDFTRRTTCIGDPLRLGGPGFTEPLGVGNVMIPQCAVTRTSARKTARAH